MFNIKKLSIQFVFPALLFVLIVFPFCARGVLAQAPLDVKELQRLINEAGYDWIAAETGVSKLSLEEKKRLCGIDPKFEEWEKQQAELQSAPFERAYSYPSYLDWRSNGGNYTTSIKDQAGCGSCVAFGVIGSIDSRLEVYQSNPNLNIDLSEAHLFSCGGGSCSLGWYISSGLNFARNTGIVDESCLPYPSGGSGADSICNQKCSNWASRVTKIASWYSVSSTADMKQALADGGPVVANMDVYDDFYSYGGGVYRHTWGSDVGGHAIAIVGYSDSGGYWIAKNSWDTDWGEQGWFRIAYGECDIDDYMYVPVVSVPSTPSAPSGVSASDGIYSDKVQVTWNSSSGATSYQVYRATSSTGTKTQLGTSTGTAFDDTTAAAITTYYYWVTACNSYGCSGYSVYDTGWRGAAGVCAPGYSLSCGNSDTWNNGGAGSTDQIDSYSCSGWNESGPEYTYTFVPNASGPVTATLSNMSADLDLFVLDGGGGTCNASNCIAYGDTAALFTAQSGHTYYLVVDGYNGATSGYNIDVQCSASSPAAPTGVSASKGTYTDKVRVTWNSSSSATSYQVWRATSSTGTKSQIGAPTGTTFDDTTAAAGATYYYWMKACNTWGCSDFSAYDTGYRSAPVTSVVINEIDPDSPDWVELRNAGSQAMTMTGWRFIAYSAGGSVDVDYTFPSFTLQPGAYVVLHENSGTNTTTDLYVGANISWVSSGACALTNGSSGIDFMRFGSSSAMPPSGTAWTGTNPSAPPIDLTLGRSPGSPDTDDGSDWCKQSASPGSQNLICAPTPASLPLGEGFESGSLGPAWSMYVTNEGRVQVSTSYPCVGNYGVLLDDSMSASAYSYAAPVLAVDLFGQSNVQLDFSWRAFNDENHSGDGVFLSDDWGATWVTAMNFNGSQSACKQESLDLDALAAANGLALNDHFMIKFQFYDNYPIDSDGYGIDDVRVSADGNSDIDVYLPVILKEE